jgi:hypothetical protein
VHDQQEGYRRAADSERPEIGLDSSSGVADQLLPIRALDLGDAEGLVQSVGDEAEGEDKPLEYGGREEVGHRAHAEHSNT